MTSPKCKKRQYEIAEMREELMKLYCANYILRCIPRMKDEDLMQNLLIQICESALDYALCCTHGQYRMREEQFNRYIWYLKRHGFETTTMFKVIGDVYKMIDEDDYYWRPKEDLREY